MEHCPSGDFSANAAWMCCAVLAHNLIRWSAKLGGLVEEELHRRRRDLGDGGVAGGIDDIESAPSERDSSGGREGRSSRARQNDRLRVADRGRARSGTVAVPSTGNGLSASAHASQFENWKTKTPLRKRSTPLLDDNEFAIFLATR